MDICPVCKGSGFVDRGQYVEPCQCRYSFEKLKHHLRIPPRFEEASLENYQPSTPSQYEALSQSIAFVENFDPKEGHGLTYLGPSGVGKTHLAVGVLKALYIKKGIRGMFVSVRELLYILKKFFDDNERYRRVLDTFMNLPILLLDDLGSEYSGDWQRDILSLIIEHRYNHCLSTLITTSRSFEDLELSFSPSLINKVRQMNTTLEIRQEEKRSWRATSSRA
ncbi:ATP-binding protein [Thermocrinis minervae]|uniref:DNA replication protein DnaC n=1 Tax=Thermocrinis minervae TaxID=381751 RepID=A0A1M6T9G5_9AQUI|nr:ATP-binding protein [Thermocrinis minervae]SHK53524.1 DNA replication protein DnaC [Thermocrinis minervae]